MRMSCNGCRVLRKGCSEDCTLRPCLQWIKTPESQANATVFLAKFYGRAGLVNLINAGPEHLRPEVFKSLLYEACGRIINPIYGSVGLMWSGNWKRVQEGVESILQGSPALMMHNQQQQGQGQGQSTFVRHPIPIIKSSDIRHLSKDSSVPPSTSSTVIHHRTRTRNRFKRPSSNIITNNTNNNNNNVVVVDSVVTSQENDDELMTEQPIKFSITGWVDSDDQQQQNQQQKQEEEKEEGLMMMMMMKRAQSHDSFSVETVEPSLVMNQTTNTHHNHDDQIMVKKSESIVTIPMMMTSSPDHHHHDHDEIALDLTLGLNPMRCAAQLSTVAATPGFNFDVV